MEDAYLEVKIFYDFLHQLALTLESIFALIELIIWMAKSNRLNSL